MADRPITTLGAAEATDLAEDTVVLHIVNPARPLDVDKNRKMTRLQLPDFLPDNSVDGAKLVAGSVADAKLGSGINAAKIADGTVSSAEFQYLNGVSSGIQAQLDRLADEVRWYSASAQTNAGSDAIIGLFRAGGVSGKTWRIHRLITGGSGGLGLNRVQLQFYDQTLGAYHGSTYTGAEQSLDTVLDLTLGGIGNNVVVLVKWMSVTSDPEDADGVVDAVEPTDYGTFTVTAQLDLV